MATPKNMTTMDTIRKDRKVKPRDLVLITWKQGKFHKAGDKSSVHTEQARKLYERGLIESYEGMPEDLQVQTKTTNGGSNTGGTGTNLQKEGADVEL
jgi:hypothetical protein